MRKMREILARLRLELHPDMQIRSPVAIVLAVAMACAPKPGADTLDGGSTAGEATDGDTGEPTGGPTDGWVSPLDCKNPGEWSRKFGGPTGSICGHDAEVTVNG